MHYEQFEEAKNAFSRIHKSKGSKKKLKPKEALRKMGIELKDAKGKLFFCFLFTQVFPMKKKEA